MLILPSLPQPVVPLPSCRSSFVSFTPSPLFAPSPLAPSHQKPLHPPCRMLAPIPPYVSFPPSIFVVSFPGLHPHCSIAAAAHPLNLPSPLVCLFCSPPLTVPSPPLLLFPLPPVGLSQRYSAPPLLKAYSTSPSICLMDPNKFCASHSRLSPFLSSYTILRHAPHT